MEGKRRITILILVLSLVVIPIRGGAKEGDRDGNKREKQGPGPIERAIGITGFTSRWDAVRTWAKLAWLSLKPPESWSSSNAKDVVKEAATRSFETVENAAESAAEVASEAVHKTKEKMKRTASTHHKHTDAEL